MFLANRNRTFTDKFGSTNSPIQQNQMIQQPSRYNSTGIRNFSNNGRQKSIGKKPLNNQNVSPFKVPTQVAIRNNDSSYKKVVKWGQNQRRQGHQLQAQSVGSKYHQQNALYDILQSLFGKQNLRALTSSPTTTMGMTFYRRLNQPIVVQGQIPYYAIIPLNVDTQHQHFQIQILSVKYTYTSNSAKPNQLWLQCQQVTQGINLTSDGTNTDNVQSKIVSIPNQSITAVTNSVSQVPIVCHTYQTNSILTTNISSNATQLKFRLFSFNKGDYQTIPLQNKGFGIDFYFKIITFQREN